jgi:hypothetical protein
MKLNWTALLCWCALATSPLWASAQAPTSSSSPLAEMVLSNGTNAAPSLDELVKLKQDPVSGLRQITIQATVSPNMPGSKRTEGNYSLEPVWPFALGEDWRVITYTILPIIPQPGASGENSVVGLGDTLINFFVSPRKAGALVWGAGPSILLPTQTNPALGSNRPALGPALGLFYPRDSWSAGVILQNGWSFGGSGINRVNAFGAQCLLSYNLPNDWFLSSNATMSANWTVAHHDRWTVPVSGGGWQGAQHRKAIGQCFAPGICLSSHPARWPDLVGEHQLAFLFP